MGQIVKAHLLQRFMDDIRLTRAVRFSCRAYGACGQGR